MTRQHRSSGEERTQARQPRGLTRSGGILAGPGMSSREADCTVLCHLMAIHQDAVDFYDQAIAQIKTNAVSGDAIVALKALHEILVDNIELRIKSGDFAPEALAAGCTGGRKYFSVLMPSLSQGADEGFLRHLEEAEENALRYCEEAMDEGVSVETQLFLAEQLGIEGHMREHLKILRTAAEETRRH